MDLQPSQNDFLDQTTILTPSNLQPTPQENTAAPPLPPKKRQLPRVVEQNNDTLNRNPFEDFDALAGFQGVVKETNTSTPLDLEFLVNSVDSNGGEKEIETDVEKFVDNNIDGITATLDSCIDRINKLRAAQFDVVRILAEEFTHDAGEKKNNLNFNFFKKNK